MNPTSPISASQATRRGRNRKNFTSKRAATEARQRELELELKDAKRAAREAAARQAQIVGYAALRAVTNHPDASFRRALVDWLREAVTKPTERAEIGALLIGGVQP
jgi:hypothetical protein